MANKRTTPIDRHVAGRLREGRKAAGLTQTEIAQKLGIAFQQIQKYENASNRITAGRLFQIGELIGKPITYFFEGLPARRTHSRSARPASASP